MLTIHPKAEALFTSEKVFSIFKHEGLICCIQRMAWGGNLNGYVAIPEGHPLFGKTYDSFVHVADKDEVAFNGNWIGLMLAACSPETEAGLLRLDMVLNVHGGLTFSKDHLCGIEDGLLGNLWWFGFDTAHSGDIRPIQTEIDRKYPNLGNQYRDFEYVIEQTKLLAEQLAKFAN